MAWRHVGDCGFPDRVAWLHALAERYPYLDLDRVGIYGHSAGGYCATRALSLHPEIYRVGWASAGSRDLLTNSAYFMEQHMGLPVDDRYREQSNLYLAPRLEGRLCLTVGALDDRAPPGNTFKIVQALIEADKDFDLLVFPFERHGSGGEYGLRRMFDYFRRHLAVAR